MLVRAMSLSLLFLICIPAMATAADLQSRVEAVTVYPEGAIVTRVATVALDAGDNEIRFVGLVKSIDSQFLQVEIADDGVRIGQIRLSMEQEREAYDSEVARVVAEIEVLIRRIPGIDDRTGAAQRRLKFLDGLAEGYAREAWVEGGRGSASIDSLRSALDLLQSASEDASEMIRNNEAEKTELRKDLSVLQRTLADLRGGSLQTAATQLTLSADRAVRTQVRIRYFQEDASWMPMYESRLDSNTGVLQLTQQAEVKQQTDEDWTNVTLSLSTSKPSGELIAPELNSEFLDIVEPVPLRARMEKAMQSEVVAYTVAEIVATGARRVDAGNFAVNYDIPGRTSVANDSDEAVTLDLARFEFDAELITQVVPRSSTQAFLAARFTYDQAVPLYGGEMLVFVDGVFAGFSEMPTALPQSEVVLPMGQDRRVDVRSESQGGAGGSRGIINRRKTEVTDFVFEITNRRDGPSYVEVLDRIPVARNRDIKVEVPRTATPPDARDLDDRPGLVQWQRTLASGEVWRIRHQYTVTYPEKYVLIRQ